jgi:hypothetical protein
MWRQHPLRPQSSPQHAFFGPDIGKQVRAKSCPASGAQTLTQPNPTPLAQTPPPKDAAKSRHTGHVKTCDAYGAGFRNIPGTDACIKIGGSVTVDGGR